MASADVAAVVVRWRGGEEVFRCLRAHIDPGGTRLGEVVGLDSGSGDDGVAPLERAFPKVRFVALAENRSFAFAVGCGVEAAGAGRLLLLNPDTEVAPGAVDALAGWLDGHPEAAGAVPLLVGADGRPQQRGRRRRRPGALRLALGLPIAAEIDVRLARQRLGGEVLLEDLLVKRCVRRAYAIHPCLA